MHPGWTGPAKDRRAFYVADRTEFLTGGLGVVYRATVRTDCLDVDPGMVVAVKQFTGDVSDDRFEKLRARAEALKQVDHPNLAKLVDVFVGPPFVAHPVDEHEATERFCAHVWIEGEPLADRCKTATPDEILRWGSEVAEALDYLHGHCTGPFAHRDIHPRNIIISDDGHATLIDYDTILADEGAETRTHALLPGTRFAPSERAEGLAGAQRDDRWSLARTFLYVLAGDPTGSMRLAEASSAGAAALKGIVADPVGIVKVLRRAIDGDDPSSADAMFRHIRRVTRRRARFPFARPPERRRNWAKSLAHQRRTPVGTARGRAVLALVVLVISGAALATVELVGHSPFDHPSRSNLGIVPPRTDTTTTNDTLNVVTVNQSSQVAASAQAYFAGGCKGGCAPTNLSLNAFVVQLDPYSGGWAEWTVQAFGTNPGGEGFSANVSYGWATLAGPGATGVGCGVLPEDVLTYFHVSCPGTSGSPAEVTFLDYPPVPPTVTFTVSNGQCLVRWERDANDDSDTPAPISASISVISNGVDISSDEVLPEPEGALGFPGPPGTTFSATVSLGNANGESVPTLASCTIRKRRS